MNESSKQDEARAKLAEAAAAIAEAGPLRHANVVCLRVAHDGGFTNVNAVIFTESADIGEIMAARLAEPTLAERVGVTPNPPISDEATYLLSEGTRLGAFNQRRDT